MTDDGRRRTEDGGRMTEDRDQRTEVRSQMSEVRSQGSEDGGRTTEDGGRKTGQGKEFEGKKSWPRFHSTFDIIEAVEGGRFPERVMMTFHPQRWTDNWVEWTKELVWQNVKNLIKKGIVSRPV